MDYKNILVGQSGGPTSAINATLAGVILGGREAAKEGKITKIYGMRNGIEGFLNGNTVALDGLTEEQIDLLINTPSSALGSCRKKLPDPSKDPAFFEAMFRRLAEMEIGYFFYIGGNDSMDTVMKMSRYAESVGYPIKVVGVPKTIDNDLACTDHTPGFGSAAKFIAVTVREILRDVNVYTVPAVTVVEIMGRDAGWLTAASTLPGIDGEVPDLIYLPEIIFDKERFLADLRSALGKHPAVLVCASEGIRFADGTYVGASGQSGVADNFGHQYLSGTGKVLEAIVRDEIGCKVRSIELSLPQRCAAHIASKTDLDESVAVGKEAVKAALGGATGVMMAFVRDSDEPYSIHIEAKSIDGIAGAVRAVPRDFINEDGNGLTAECIRYLAPLIRGESQPVYENGMPKHLIL